METKIVTLNITNFSNVLTVPMRNGNAPSQSLYDPVYGSYRTYEEWKHNEKMKRKMGRGGSYRTYEEWKR